MTREEAQNIINLSVKDNTSKQISPANVREALAAVMDYAQSMAQGAPYDEVSNSNDFTFVVTAPAVINDLLIKGVEGGIIRFGTTPGGTQIAFDVDLTGWENKWYPVSLKYPVNTDTVVYVTGVSSLTHIRVFKTQL